MSERHHKEGQKVIQEDIDYNIKHIADHAKEALHDIKLAESKDIKLNTHGFTVDKLKRII